ncbi:CinA family protein [Atopobium sp. oral taxon 416]|uniref:CinA family protein n=1 Tax=Atopobium sp. oral taxon 416 TaxID=712157 RepID=UPI001BAC59B9|nr:CinA family protein [Atopobium sp. oral taxon 416]QUC02124.1 CinA family protein [Atopobium sp. oral taxon 416]
MAKSLGDMKLPSCQEQYSLAEELVHTATDRHVTVGTAESCTGGLVAGAITDVPGSSEMLRGGVVSYAIPVKHAVLGVSNEILNKPGVGAISSECAEQMAEGARKVLEPTYAVSITGIAGPGGEEPGKPVGTVWFGLAGDRIETTTELHTFSGTRPEVRNKAVYVALQLLLKAVKNA